MRVNTITKTIAGGIEKGEPAQVIATEIDIAINEEWYDKQKDERRMIIMR